MMKPVAVDAMGGDAAPNMVVEGVNISSRKLSGVQYLLFGNVSTINFSTLKHFNTKLFQPQNHFNTITLQRF